MTARGRGGPLAAAGIVVLLGLGILGGALAIRGEAPYAGVGPRAFPVLIGAGLAGLGLLLGVGVLRGTTVQAEGGEDVDADQAADWRAIAWVLAGLGAAVLLLERAGFPVVAALAFAGTARGFGSRRPGRDLAVGLLLGVATWLLFARALGVSLPGGVLERL